mgnify:CR=1 FL=1
MTSTNYYYARMYTRKMKESYIYLIQRKQKFDIAGVWYFHELGDLISVDTHSILWTPTMRNAHTFQTEQDVEEFKNDFLIERDTEIIRIKRS